MPPKVVRPSKPRPRTRVLMRWKDEHDKILLLAIQSYIGKNKISVDWDSIARMVDDKATGGAIVQHLAKIRDRLKSEGHNVPPSIRQSGGRTRQGRSVKKATSNVVGSSDDWEAYDVEMTGMGEDDTDTTHSLARRLPSKRKRSNPDFLRRSGMETSSNDGEDDGHSSSSTATCGNDDDSEIVGANDPAMRFDSAVRNNSTDIGMRQRDLAIVHDTSNAGHMSLEPFRVPQNNGQVLPSHLDAQPAPKTTTGTKNSAGPKPKQHHQGKSIIVSFPAILIKGVAELRTRTEVMVPPKKKAKTNPKESSSTKPKFPKNSTRVIQGSRPARPTKPLQQNKVANAAGSISAKNPADPKISAREKQKAKEHAKTLNTKFPVKRSGSDTNHPHSTHFRKLPQSGVPKDPDSGASHSSSTLSNPTRAPPSIGDDEIGSMPRRKYKVKYQFDKDWGNLSPGPSSPPDARVSQNESRSKVLMLREQLRDAKRQILVERTAAKVKVEEEDQTIKSSQPVWEVEDSLESLAKAHGIGPEQNYGNYHPSQLSDFSSELGNATEPSTNEVSVTSDDSSYPRANVDEMCAEIIAKHAKGKKLQGLLASSGDPVCYSWPGPNLDTASVNGDIPKKRVDQFEDLVNLLDNDENFHEKVNPYPQEPKRSPSLDWELSLPQYILDDYEIGEDGAVQAKYDPILDDIEWSGVGFADPDYATAVPINTDFTPPTFTAPTYDDPAFADPASAFTGTGFTAPASAAPTSTTPAFTAPISAGTGYFDPNMANLTRVGPGIPSAGPFDFPQDIQGTCDPAATNFQYPLADFGYNASGDASNTPFTNNLAGSIVLPPIPADCLLDGDRGTSEMVGAMPAGIDPNRPMGFTSFSDIEAYPYPRDALEDLNLFKLAGQPPPVAVEDIVTAMSMGSSLNFDNYGDRDNFGMAVHLDMSVLNHDTNGAGNTGDDDGLTDNGPTKGPDTTNAG